MRELLVAAQNISDENGTQREYTYSILIDEMSVGAFSCESYGVKIKDCATGRVAVVSHVTASIPRIDELMELLIRNQVTPVGLRDVLEDWI